MPARVFVCVCDVVASTKAPNGLQHKIGDHSFYIVYIYIVCRPVHTLKLHWLYWKPAHTYAQSLQSCTCLYNQPLIIMHICLLLCLSMSMIPSPCWAHYASRKWPTWRTKTHGNPKRCAWFGIFCFDALRFFWLVVNQVPCNNSL